LVPYGRGGGLDEVAIPAVTIGPGGYLLVWASGKDKTDPARPLHTNFRLEKAGDFLALADSAGNILSAFAPQFPAQHTDISYGRDRADLSVVGYFQTPTPGGPDALGGAGFAGDPVPSRESGIYTNSALTLTLTIPEGAMVRYTVDGSLPGTNSPLYTGPLTFGTNVTVKARAFQAGLLPSRVVARTFIFLDATTRDFNSNLPLMILSTAGRVIPESGVAPGQARTKGALLAIDLDQGRASLQAQLSSWAWPISKLSAKRPSAFRKNRTLSRCRTNSASTGTSRCWACARRGLEARQSLQ
jgi:hypothetical protein